MSFFLFFALLFLRGDNVILADSIDDCINNNDTGDYCMNLIKERIKGLDKAINPLKIESTDLQKKITSARSQINQISSQISNFNKRLTEKETELNNQKKLLGERVRRYYKSSKKFTPLLIFLSNSEGASLLQQYTLYQSVISQDKNMITKYTSDINSLNKIKTELETETTKLAYIRKTLENRFSFLGTEITKAEIYKNKLTQDLLNLEAKRISSLNLPTSAAGTMMCGDDRKIDPGFGTAFAFYTFGIPHHVGLNQYGAYGRANAGQDYKTILNAYFNNISIEKKSNINITVDGFGSMSIEQYMLGIYEVPNDWPIEALKAQAIAARSYAMAFTNSGAKSICTTQKCQVYKGGNKGGKWEQAVKATEGEILIHNGQIVKAYFASTAGGYTYLTTDINWPGSNPSFIKRTRDTSGDVNSFEDLQNKAYDKDSKCFYAAQGYRKEYNNSAWLRPSEVADIVNATILGQKDSSIQGHLCQSDISGGCCVKNSDGSCKYEAWSVEKIKSELSNRGTTPYTTINSVSISWDKNSGFTTQISLSGDAGSVSFDGSTWKSYFNSRAPANIAIVGPLFNIEKR